MRHQWDRAKQREPPIARCIHKANFNVSTKGVRLSSHSSGASGISVYMRTIYRPRTSLRATALKFEIEVPMTLLWKQTDVTIAEVAENCMNHLPLEKS